MASSKREKHVANRFADHGGGIERDRVFHSRRKALRKLCERGLGVAIYIERIRSRQLRHAEADRVVAIEAQVRVVSFSAQFRAAHVFEAHERSIACPFSK